MNNPTNGKGYPEPRKRGAKKRDDMKKPTITLSKPLGLFLRDGEVISDDEARALWDAGTADWSQAAFQMMASKALS